MDTRSRKGSENRPDLLISVTIGAALGWLIYKHQSRGSGRTSSGMLLVN